VSNAVHAPALRFTQRGNTFWTHLTARGCMMAISHYGLLPGQTRRAGMSHFTLERQERYLLFCEQHPLTRCQRLSAEYALDQAEAQGLDVTRARMLLNGRPAEERGPGRIEERVLH
jgi:hypothetical protein